MFVKVCDKHAPNVTHGDSKKRSAPKNPWISAGIVKSIRRKHNLYKKYRTSNFNEEYGNEYRKYRNTLVTTIKNAKRMYYSNSFSENKNNMSKTWGIIKEVIIVRGPEGATVHPPCDPTFWVSFCSLVSLLSEK